jgi:EAL domain-containing protein (putative c-di-GMP-specific phosphodiesterase class I)
VAVNLFEADLVDTELVVRVAAACDAAGLPADLLQIEVTESITASVVGQASPNLAALAERGHTLLLDDFGTGYSSLSFLRDLPLDVVKLDRSFFADLDRQSVRTIVSSTVGMAHALGLRIVAEGVETQAALVAVRELGCDAVQGFVMHRPVAAAEFTALLLRDLTSPGETPVAT